jgi:hypothetical protein
MKKNFIVAAAIAGVLCVGGIVAVASGVVPLDAATVDTVNQVPTPAATISAE